MTRQGDLALLTGASGYVGGRLRLALEAGGHPLRCMTRRPEQTALFDPIGVGGLLYWYGLWGIHQLVFAGMPRSIVAAARGRHDPPNAGVASGPRAAA